MIDGRRRRTATAPQQVTDAPAQSWWRLGTVLVRIGVTADAVTLVGIALAAATAVLIGFGHLFAAVFLLTAGGLMDALDGIVAKAAGSASARGAFFDSVADRISDGLVFGGLTWHLLLGAQPREAILPVAILAVSALISYERAKAESLGFNARGGLMERAERLILLGVALFFHVVLISLLLVLLALCIATAAGRFVRVWRIAGGVPPRPALGRARMESQWRAWRESGRARSRRNTRSRRSLEPAGTRLRKVLGSERAAAPVGRRAGGRRRAALALRERFDGGR
ncbi:MAG TPA: CDP-alcohol phosphatidyltransferase family protein [Acidimicrobiales bacterium]|nr:CDP-alcohol phosphatidyltransferase family protein [Acidimicrobiales bacterium]